MSVMNRIIAHHTGGAYTPNGTDLRAYHSVFDGDGGEHQGRFDVLDNAPGRISKGNYAAHTWKLNTGSIGRAIAAMGGKSQTWADPFGGKYPVKPEQVDALVLRLAADAKEHSIPVDRQHVLTHAEVQITLGVTQRNKWDFDYDLRGGAGRDPVLIGDTLRQEVLLKMGDKSPTVPKQKRRMLVRGHFGKDVKEAQRALGIDDDGGFGPDTFAAVVKFQKARGLLPDGEIGALTWAELLR